MKNLLKGLVVSGLVAVSAQSASAGVAVEMPNVTVTCYPFDGNLGNLEVSIQSYYGQRMSVVSVVRAADGQYLFGGQSRNILNRNGVGAVTYSPDNNRYTRKTYNVFRDIYGNLGAQFSENGIAGGTMNCEQRR